MIVTQIISSKPFTDCVGGVNSNGYLTFALSTSCSVTDGSAMIGYAEVTLQLDSNGQVITTPPQFLWANDILLPPNSYYIVTGYSANGQHVWGPNYITVTSGGVGGGVFDLCVPWGSSPAFTYIIDEVYDFLVDELGVDYYILG